MQSIPRGPGDVTPAWLGSALGVEVRDVAVTPIGTGQTGATYRVAATYAAEREDLPTSFAIKLSAQDEDLKAGHPQVKVVANPPVSRAFSVCRCK